VEFHVVDGFQLVCDCVGAFGAAGGILIALLAQTVFFGFNPAVSDVELVFV